MYDRVGLVVCALSKSYFLISTSQYWERFENVRFFCATASKRSNMVLELEEAKPMSARL